MRMLWTTPTGKMLYREGWGPSELVRWGVAWGIALRATVFYSPGGDLEKIDPSAEEMKAGPMSPRDMGHPVHGLSLIWRYTLATNTPFVRRNTDKGRCNEGSDNSLSLVLKSHSLISFPLRCVVLWPKHRKLLRACRLPVRNPARTKTEFPTRKQC